MEYVFTRNAFASVCAALAISMLFCEYPVEWISRKIGERSEMER